MDLVNEDQDFQIGLTEGIVKFCHARKPFSQELRVQGILTVVLDGRKVDIIPINKTVHPDEWSTLPTPNEPPSTSAVQKTSNVEHISESSSDPVITVLLESLVRS